MLRAWLASVGLDADPRELIAMMQADDFSHAELARRARRAHERSLREAVDEIAAAAAAGEGYAEAAKSLFERLRPGDPLRAGDDDPRQRDGEADHPRRRARAGGAGRRRRRLDARRHPHDRAHPRARRRPAGRSR